MRNIENLQKLKIVVNFLNYNFEKAQKTKDFSVNIGGVPIGKMIKRIEEVIDYIPKYKKPKEILIALNPVEHILKKLTKEEQKELIDYLCDKIKRGKENV